MNLRKIAGWSLLSLLPIGFAVLAIITDSGAEALLGLGIAVVIAIITFVGTGLLANWSRP